MLIISSYILLNRAFFLSMQGDGVAAGKEKEDEDIGDLDDLLRREREMEKKSKESAPADTEVP